MLEFLFGPREQKLPAALPPKFLPGEPAGLDEYVNQMKAKIDIHIELQLAYKQPWPCLRHILLTGNAGMGKTMLAKIIAHELGATFTPTTATSLTSPSDIAKLFLRAAAGCEEQLTPTAPVIFIDEIHALSKKLQESLYIPLAEGQLDIKTKRIDWAPFTLIAATTEGGDLTQALLTRFPRHIKLAPYTIGDISVIVRQRAGLWNISITEEQAWEIAKRSRLTPRIALNHLRGASVLGLNNLKHYFGYQNIDDNGMGDEDRALLRALKSVGRPCSLKALATMTNINQSEIEYMLEPYLVQLGYIVLTARGRKLADNLPDNF